MPKKKILIVNKFLYPRGGDCIHSLNLGEMLKQEGHEVMFFSMKYPFNNSFQESSYFADEVSFSSGTINDKIKAALRIFGYGIKRKFNKLLDEFRPDVVHLNNIHSYISPLVAKLAYKRGIKIVWTMHDYKLICPSYSCLYKGHSCEACFRNKSKVLTRKCFKNNLMASLLAYLEIVYWNKDKFTRWVDVFICPSNFLAHKMEIAGFLQEKLVVLSNFISKDKFEAIQAVPCEEKENAYCYVGRLSQEKGIRELLDVAARLPYKLYVVGSGPLADELKHAYSSNQIIFLGFQDAPAIIALLKRVHFSVIPSICYENNPFSVIESLCCGTPVLGADIGGIPELITDNNGKLFDPADREDLKRKIYEMFNTDKYNRKEISEFSIQRYSWSMYYEKLLALYQK